MTTMTDRGRTVVAGVDTHADSHTVAVLDQVGRRLGHQQFPATGVGYRQLRDWITSHGTVTGVGVEGSGSYGAGLTRDLQAAGLQVWEINRPDRSTRRAAASPTRSTPRSPPAASWPTVRPARRGPARGTATPSAWCTPCALPRSRPAPQRSTSCTS